MADILPTSPNCMGMPELSAYYRAENIAKEYAEAIKAPSGGTSNAKQKSDGVAGDRSPEGKP